MAAHTDHGEEPRGPFAHGSLHAAADLPGTLSAGRHPGPLDRSHTVPRSDSNPPSVTMKDGTPM